MYQLNSTPNQIPRVSRELFPKNEKIESVFMKDPKTFREETKRLKEEKFNAKLKFSNFNSGKKAKPNKNRPSWNYNGIKGEEVKAGGIILMCYRNGQIFLLMRKMTNPITGQWYYEDNGGKSDNGDSSISEMQIREFCEETNGIIQKNFPNSSDDELSPRNPYLDDPNPFAILEISNRHDSIEKKIEYRSTVCEIKRSISYIRSLMVKNPKVEIYSKLMKYVISFVRVEEEFFDKYTTDTFGKKELYEDVERTIEWVSLTDFLNAIQTGNIHARLANNLDLKIRDNFKSFIHCFSDLIWKNEPVCEF